MAFKQRKFRSKANLEDEEAEDGLPQIRPSQPQAKKPEPAGPHAKPALKILAATKAEPKKDSSGTKLNLLSFVEDGDDPGFVLKKDSKKNKQRQYKLARAPALPDLPTDTAPQTLCSNAGEYTTERLNELQRNAISFSATRLVGPEEGADGGGAGPAPSGGSGSGGAGKEPVIKLSGSFKPAGAAKDDRFSLRESSLAVEEMPPPPPISRAGGPTAPPTSGAAAAMTARGGDKGAAGGGGVAAGDEDDGDDSAIPDQQTILAAKAKRERLRQAHLAPDYIPTSGLGLGSLGRGGGGGGVRGGLRAAVAGPGGGEGGGSGSDSGEEAEEAMRIRFSGREAGRPRKDLSQYSHTAPSGGDDDEEAFAQEQLRKALRLQQVGGAGAAAVATDAAVQPPPFAAQYAPGPGSSTNASMYDNSMRLRPMAAAPAPGMYGSGSGMASMQAAGDSVVTSLAEALQRLHASHKQVTVNVRRTADNLTAALGRVEGLEVDLSAAGDKYVYMQRLKSYVADLCDCLQVKSAIVEELEDSRLELMEDRAAAARSTAAFTARDLLAPAEAAAAAAMTALGRGAGAVAAATAAAAAVAEAEEALLDEEGSEEEVDEFGRNTNLQRRRELQERAKARKKLLATESERLAAAQAGGVIQPLTAGEVAAGQAVGPREGDAASSSASVRYAVRYSEIVEAGDAVFADTDEEYATIGAVKRRLEEWKARYPKDYTNAYMHLSTPALFAPYVRLQLLQWDPLYGSLEGHGSYTGFNTQEWYGELFEYGMKGGEGGEGAAASALLSGDDPDGDLVPQLVRKLVLPLGLHWVNRCWDIRNLGHTRAVAAIASELLVYLPPEEPDMTELLAGIRSGLEATVTEAALPPWPPAVLAVSPIAAAVLFYRFRTALGVLQCLAAFEGLLSQGLLVGLALGKMVGGQMMPYLRAAASPGGGGGGGGGVIGGDGGLAFGVAVVEAVAGVLHPEWFAGGPPGEAAPLVEHLAGLAGAVERLVLGQQQRRGLTGGAGGGPAALAGRLGAVCMRLGDVERGRRLVTLAGVVA